MPRVSKKKPTLQEEGKATTTVSKEPSFSLNNIFRQHLFRVHLILVIILILPTLLGTGLYILHRQDIRNREEQYNQIASKKRDELYNHIVATRIHDTRDAILASSVIVYDLSRDISLVSDNASTPLGIASLTKIILAYMIVSRPDYNPDTLITISSEALEEPGDQALFVGQRLPLGTALALMLRTSSNDIAHALGEAFPNLLNDMNTYAVTTLNSPSLILQNITGLDQEEVLGASGSASDMLSVLRMWWQNSPETLIELGDPLFEKFETEFAVIPEHTHENILTLPRVLFSKTGYTDLAGGCIATVVRTEDGRVLAIILLGSTFEGRFSDLFHIVSIINSSSALLTF